MHEFSIGERIVEAVLETAETMSPPPTRIKRAFLTVGEMHQIIPDYLTFAYETLTKGTFAEGSILEMTFIPVEVTCTDCGWIGPIEKPYFICGSCKKTKVDVVKGMEMTLDRLEAEIDDDAGN